MLSKTHEFNHWLLRKHPVLMLSFKCFCMLLMLISMIAVVALSYAAVTTATSQVSTARAAQHKLEDLLNGRAILVDQSNGYAEARITWVGTCIDGRPIIGRLNDYQNIREN